MPVLLLAALAFILFKSASELTDKITFEPVGFNLIQSTLSLKIINPTETSATVQNVQGNIYAGSVKIGSYYINQGFIIPAYNSATIKVQIKLDKIETFNQILEVIKKGQTPKISITGSIGTSLGRIAFENTIVEKNTFKNAA